MNPRGFTEVYQSILSSRNSDGRVFTRVVKNMLTYARIIKIYEVFDNSKSDLLTTSTDI